MKAHTGDLRDLLGSLIECTLWDIYPTHPRLTSGGRKREKGNVIAASETEDG
jgi:hypothetical protein